MYACVCLCPRAQYIGKECQRESAHCHSDLPAQQYQARRRISSPSWYTYPHTNIAQRDSNAQLWWQFLQVVVLKLQSVQSLQVAECVRDHLQLIVRERQDLQIAQVRDVLRNRDEFVVVQDDLHTIQTIVEKVAKYSGSETHT